MTKILCPTDFSEVALNAISYAAKFSKEIGADLTLFYVESMDETTTAELVRGKSMTTEADAEKLEDLSREISATFHISCYSEIQPSSGSVSKLISAKAEEFDLIIMGTSGAVDFYKGLAGSNTYRVIQSASIPVLYVPEGYIYNQISSIVYAFDYLHDYKLPLEQLKFWIEKTNSKLKVLQVTEPLDANKKFKLKEIQRQIKNIYLDEISMEFVTIENTHIANSIDEFASRNDVDLLALCTHHYSLWENLFHKSVIKSISSKANYPVFVFHK